MASQFEFLPQMVKFAESSKGIFEIYSAVENSLRKNNLQCLQLCIDNLTPFLRTKMTENNFCKFLKNRDYSGCDGSNVEAHSLFRKNFGRDSWEFKLNSKTGRFEAYDERGVMRSAKKLSSFDANLMISRFPDHILDQPESPTKFYAIIQKIVGGDVELLDKILIFSQNRKFPLRYGTYHLLHFDDFFCQCLRSGKIEIVNKFLEYYSPFPELDLKGKRLKSSFRFFLLI